MKTTCLIFYDDINQHGKQCSGEHINWILAIKKTENCISFRIWFGLYGVRVLTYNKCRNEFCMFNFANSLENHQNRIYDWKDNRPFYAYFLWYFTISQIFYFAYEIFLQKFLELSYSYSYSKFLLKWTQK